VTVLSPLLFVSDVCAFASFVSVFVAVLPVLVVRELFAFRAGRSPCR
jgi:hypothetical protein